MTLTATREVKRSVLAGTAGWIAVAFGVVHTVVAPWDYRDYWETIVDEGPWQTLTLDHDPGAMGYNEAFWIGPGSFGVPVLLFGAFVVWINRRGERVPTGFGWALTVWAAFLCAVMPSSPAWALLLAGVLLVIAPRTRGSATL